MLLPLGRLAPLEPVAEKDRLRALPGPDSLRFCIPGNAPLLAWPGKAPLLACPGNAPLLPAPPPTGASPPPPPGHTPPVWPPPEKSPLPGNVDGGEGELPGAPALPGNGNPGWLGKFDASGRPWPNCGGACVPLPITKPHYWLLLISAGYLTPAAADATGGVTSRTMGKDTSSRTTGKCASRRALSGKRSALSGEAGAGTSTSIGRWA